MGGVGRDEGRRRERGRPEGHTLDLRIEPKVQIERLLFLLGYARSPDAWRTDIVQMPAALDLVSAVGESVARLTDRALRQGSLQGDRTIDQAGLTIRGRVRHKDQIQRRLGAALPIEVTYDEFTVDIAENQLLLAGMRRVLGLPGLDDTTRIRLNRLRNRFEGVSRLTPGTALPPWRASRLNARYQPALHLAEVILTNTSFELGRGDVPATGFLISMPTLFEDFVTTALAEELERRYGGTCQHQDSRWWWDSDRQVVLRPDLVWYPQGGEWPYVARPGVVVDAKYKTEKPSGFPNAVIFQMLGYCSALGLSDGHLVYARGNEPRQTLHLPETGPDGAGVTVHAHVLDLDAPPEELFGQVARVAEAALGRARIPRQKEVAGFTGDC